SGVAFGLRGRARLAERLLVLGSALRNDHDLAEAALADAHGRDALGIAQREMDRTAIPGAHRVEGDRASRLARAPGGPAGAPRDPRSALLEAALDLEDDPVRLVAAAHRSLIGEHLERIDGPPVAPAERLRRRTAQRDHDYAALPRLGDLEGAEAHPLDRAQHEAPDLPARP